MKKILVLYYSQSGQMKDILTSLTDPLKEQADFVWQEIKPVQPFPFPWTTESFFDVMPEAVLQIPPEIEPMPEIEDSRFDLIILGYQPWFLSPSQPTTGFLHSRWAAVCKDTPVLTVIGCRNMWLHAQEAVKKNLENLGAVHCGNIVLEDRHSNLTALKGIIRWMFTGKKTEEGKPEAGVSAQEIKESSRFAKPIAQCLAQNDFSRLQEKLLALGAVILRPNLIVMEKRGVSQFPAWAKRAREKGLPGNPERAKVIKKFQRLLIIAIFVLSPITSAIGALQTALRKKHLMKEVDYFKSVNYESGKL